VRANYPETFLQLGTVDGMLYGFIMKANPKATVWYDPQFFADNGFAPLEANATFDDLLALSARIQASGTPPWSNGQSANGGTGFPGSDTIQQILINDAGVDVYDQVMAGTRPYTDPAVRDAWEEFGQLFLTPGSTVQGDGAAMASTPFGDSAYPPFEDPPRAAMAHLAGFAPSLITGRFPDAVPGESFDFFPWPGGAVTGGANIAYAFNSDPATCSFLSHIASAEAQEIWAERGGFTSANAGVDEFAYPDGVSRELARQLIDAPVFRFDLDDAIGGAAQQAIFQGVVQYLRDPWSLDAILEAVEAARE
jgi:alpha-glucoside transport system substrate-binding protein